MSSYVDSVQLVQFGNNIHTIDEGGRAGGRLNPQLVRRLININTTEFLIACGLSTGVGEERARETHGFVTMTGCAWGGRGASLYAGVHQSASTIQAPCAIAFVRGRRRKEVGGLQVACTYTSFTNRRSIRDAHFTSFIDMCAGTTQKTKRGGGLQHGYNTEEQIRNHHFKVFFVGFGFLQV